MLPVASAGATTFMLPPVPPASAGVEEAELDVLPGAAGSTRIRLKVARAAVAFM